MTKVFLAVIVFLFQTVQAFSYVDCCCGQMCPRPGQVCRECHTPHASSQNGPDLAGMLAPG